MLVGAAWALPAGLIRAYRNGHEVITTIMLNSVAVYLTGYLVEGPLKSKTLEEPSTDTLSAATRLPNLYSAGNFQLSAGLLIGIVATAAIAVWLQRTISGYELQAVGANATAARFAGVDPKRVVVRSMLLSGAIAGLAGAVQVLAYEGRFYVGFSPGYGFDALGVALLAGNSALGVIPAGLLFGVLTKGGVALQVDNVPKGITTVILGLLILIAAAVRYRGVKTVA
jgi:simple sugar transport system permease protein